MLKQLIIASAAAACASASFANTTVGGATLIDTAVVHTGTVTSVSYLSYVSGGNGTTGTADGSSYTIGGYTPADAMTTADHAWLQFGDPILMYSATALTVVIAVPARPARP